MKLLIGSADYLGKLCIFTLSPISKSVTVRPIRNVTVINAFVNIPFYFFSAFEILNIVADDVTARDYNHLIHKLVPDLSPNITCSRQRCRKQ